MHLVQLIYASTHSTSGLLRRGFDSDLGQIMTKAVNNNRRLNVTGILTYGDNHFLQLLEGDHHVVSELFLKISADKRHQDVVLIDFSHVSMRSFEKWAMSHYNVYTLGDNRLLRYTTDNKFYPHDFKPETAVQLLTEIRDTVTSIGRSTKNGRLRLAQQFEKK